MRKKRITKPIPRVKCVLQLEKVFNPKEKPWIKLHSASAEDIIAVVGQCPSGALSVVDSGCEGVDRGPEKAAGWPS